VLDVVYYINQYGNPVFRRVKTPDESELELLAQRVDGS